MAGASRGRRAHTTGAKLGRPSLGPRNEHKIRVPEVIDLQQQAMRRGFKNMNDYVCALLLEDAERTDVPLQEVLEQAS